MSGRASAQSSTTEGPSIVKRGEMIQTVSADSAIMTATSGQRGVLTGWARAVSGSGARGAATGARVASTVVKTHPSQ